MLIEPECMGGYDYYRFRRYSVLNIVSAEFGRMFVMIPILSKYSKDYGVEALAETTIQTINSSKMIKIANMSSYCKPFYTVTNLAAGR